jgi:AraC family transcriptional regulator
MPYPPGPGFGEHPPSVYIVTSFTDREFAPSGVQDFEGGFEILDRIAAHAWPVFVSNESCVSKIRNGIRHESVIHFVSFVNFIAARNAGHVEMANPIEVVTNVTYKVAISDLNVVAIEENLHARRVHFLANVQPPGQVIEDLVRALVGHDFCVRDFHTQSDVFLLRVTLYPIENGDGIVRALLIGHSPALTGKRNQSRTPDFSTQINAFVKLGFELVVHFFPDQTILKTCTASRQQRRRQSVVFQNGHLLGGRQIDSFEADTRQGLTPVRKGKSGVPPDRTHYALFEPAFTCSAGRGLNGRRNRRRRNNTGAGHSGEEFSAFHGFHDGIILTHPRRAMKKQQPQYLFPAAAKFGKDNLVLHASARRHVVHDFAGPLSIKSVLRGEVDWIVDGRRLQVDPTTFLVLNESQTYSMDIDSTWPVETCCVFFHRGFVEQVAQDVTTPLAQSLESPWRTALDLRFQSLLHSDGKRAVLPQMWSLAQRCSQGFQPSSFEEDFLILSEKLLTLHREIKSQISRVPAGKPSTRDELFRRLQVAREYLHGNLHNRISLDDVSREACISRYHLHRAFKQVFRSTPHAYLTKIRMERGRILLETGHSALETSVALGLANPSAFTRLFRAHYGVPPSAYSKISKIRQAVR